MPAKYRMQGMGWLPDFPDLRDRTPDIRSCSRSSRGHRGRAAVAAGTVDLSEWCSPVENQGSLGSCTANAAVGLYEYFERRERTTRTSMVRACSSTRRPAISCTGRGTAVRSSVPRWARWCCSEFRPRSIGLTTKPKSTPNRRRSVTRSARTSRRCSTCGSTAPAGMTPAAVVQEVKTYIIEQVPRDVRLHGVQLDRSSGCRGQDSPPGDRGRKWSAVGTRSSRLATTTR